MGYVSTTGGFGCCCWRPKPNSLIVYAVAPIDDWTGWQHPIGLFPMNPDWNGVGYNYHRDWERIWPRARRLAFRLGWDGTDSHGWPLVTFLPCPPNVVKRSPVVTGWKSRSGGTFVASERFPLPWLCGGGNKCISGRLQEPRLPCDHRQLSHEFGRPN
jgi:hypothetical protein